MPKVHSLNGSPSGSCSSAPCTHGGTIAADLYNPVATDKQLDGAGAIGGHRQCGRPLDRETETHPFYVWPMKAHTHSAQRTLLGKPITTHSCHAGCDVR
eukprot:1403191-Amphidinium_carterae.1